MDQPTETEITSELESRWIIATSQLYSARENFATHANIYASILKTIRDDKLYLVKYKTWNEFCVTEAKHARQWINRLISNLSLSELKTNGKQAVTPPNTTIGVDSKQSIGTSNQGVSNNTTSGLVESADSTPINQVELASSTPNGKKLPTKTLNEVGSVDPTLQNNQPRASNSAWVVSPELSEKAKMAIVKVPERLRKQVVDRAMKTGQVTYKSVTDAARAIKEEDPVRVDATNFIIPPELVELYDRRSEVIEMRKRVSEIRCTLRHAQDNKDPLYSEVITSMAISELDAVYGNLGSTIPYAVCPYCQGLGREGCKACKTRGFISENFYTQVCDPLVIELRNKVIAQRLEQEAAEKEMPTE